MIPNKLTCLTMGRKIKNLKRCYFKFYIIFQVLSINQKQLRVKNQVTSMICVIWLQRHRL